ncbi:MAG: phosphopantetheine-binding protein [Terrimicrobiaceae bacterium]|nr:phosphopantetheine-binding protein [Terrimicrobiaceae bacterium]
MGSPVTTAPIEQRLAALIAERILDPAGGLAPETNLYDAGLDSLAIMQLLLLLEEEFSIAIPVESVSRANFATIRAIAGLLREKGCAMGCDDLLIEPNLEPAEPEAAAFTPMDEPPPAGPLLATMRGCDYFTLCFDHWSRKSGQGGHKAHSFLLLDRIPDYGKLGSLIADAPRRYPLLFGRLKRRRIFGEIEWRRAGAEAPIEVRLVSETGSPGILRNAGGESCADAWETADDVVNIPLPPPFRGGLPMIHFTLIELRGGGAMLIFSWSHLLMDGVGAEFFLCELARLAGEFPGGAVPSFAAPGEVFGWKETFERAKPMVQYFNRLVQRKFDCLGPREPRPGRTHFEIHTLTAEQTRSVNARCASFCGELVSMPFFLACAARAHERVFAARGLSPDSHVCSVPVQTRRKGARGPIFQNHITMFFGVLSREELGELDRAVSALVAQHAAFHKNRLGDALDRLMHMMNVLPPGLYMKFIQFQMRGPFASFFHSHTGEFAPGLDQFLGAKITNAFHAPGIATPPGSGIFCNEKNGRLIITLSWHEEALSAEERRLMMDQLLRDFGLA